MSFLSKRWQVFLAGSVALIVVSLLCVIVSDRLETNYGPDFCRLPLSPWFFVVNWSLIVLAAASVVCTIAAAIGSRSPIIALLMLLGLLLPGLFFLYIGVAVDGDSRAPGHKAPHQHHCLSVTPFSATELFDDQSRNEPAR
ncbi:hypothetical protein [Nocardia sp. CY41]|uniref:hypothetical protein n=1 Tax=Nocardia sp. CY41 TaxID=2608686 RepID=UPI00135A216A|nr:hypothetical protein [Nocardia sp. CY41]